MFEIGQLVIYGNDGVCRVEKIGKMEGGLASSDRQYYTLSPLKRKGSHIFTPVDNQKVIMRSTLSKAAAMELLDEIQNVETLWIGDERNREQEYKDAIRKCDCREYVKIIKTISLRKVERLADGKKVTAVDEKYCALAEDNLYGELSVSLGMDKDETRAYVEKRLNFI